MRTHGWFASPEIEGKIKRTREDPDYKPVPGFIRVPTFWDEDDGYVAPGVQGYDDGDEAENEWGAEDGDDQDYLENVEGGFDDEEDDDYESLYDYSSSNESLGSLMDIS